MPAPEDFHHLEPLAAAALAGYFLGALPFGYLVAKSRGIDIFKEGSGSSGATNVRRLLGARAGNTVFVLDALKGALAAGWPLYFAFEPKLLGFIGLIFAMFGHSFSCFAGFRGGKGVATGAGGFLVLLPLPTLISAAVWIGVFFLSRYVSLASICSALALPLAAWVLGRPPSWLTTVSAVVCAFVIWRHRANIGRLLNGTESRAGGKG
jgi:acyl phosphate:glycerol-3-phosphate acyltransferase